MLLITTPLQVLSFDPSRGEANLLRTGDGEYFGLTWGADVIVISHSGMNNESLGSWEDYRAAPRGYLSLHASKGTSLRTPTVLLQPHQIELVDDAIVATNTGRNRLSVFETDGSLRAHVQLDDVEFDWNEAGRTGSHFNSVHRSGDRLWVVAHNHDRPSSVWELAWPRLEVLSTHATTASWAHNMWIGEHGKVICDSRHGSLLEVDSGETIWSSGEKDVVTRGLAVVGDHLYIGRSEFADRGLRVHNNGGLWVVDRKTLRTVERHIFPGSGCVNDLRAFRGQDECHVQHPFQPAWLDWIRRRSVLGSVSYELRRRPRVQACYLNAKRRLFGEQQR